MLSTEITYLKGVGPGKASVLNKELEIFTYGDLLHYYPYRYLDKGSFTTIAQINNTATYILLRGFLSQVKEIPMKRGKRLVALFSDNTGIIELVWFKNVKWIKDVLKPGTEYVLFGKPTYFNSKYNIAHPELESIEKWEKGESGSLRPMYNTSEKMKNIGLDSKNMHHIMLNLLSQLNSQIVYENLPHEVLAKYKLTSRLQSLKYIHNPQNTKEISEAHRRLKFEELFFLQLEIIKLKLKHTKQKGWKTEPPYDIADRFIKKFLPFALTNAQNRVLDEITQDLESGLQMNRLLQGDVGSGKTIVALISILKIIEGGMQACMMAPTEILAQQHFISLSELLFPLGINIELLTGSTTAAKKKKLVAQLQEGLIHVIVGTHALTEDYVQFKKLGLVIIDEQHRFGVNQRAKLWEKNEIPPHILIMSATPIPRTLAMTFYGDLEVSVIDELPPGRKPISTAHRYESSRLAVFGFIRKEIEVGRQIYIVYPLIEESEKSDLNNLMEGYESICRAFPEYKISILHGKMKPDAKAYEMKNFVEGKTHIMVSTTVIEVGVNVPNASVMLIENANRFGLSQLHQLRGRVGRGAEQSYCILMTNHNLTEEAKIRLDTMVNTNDGFEIAEVDLKLRGPGDLSGTKQSGEISSLKIADLAKDGVILEEARKTAISLMEEDPFLQKEENKNLSRFLKEEKSENSYYSKIS